MKKYQAFNPRIDAWVVYNQYADGHCEVVAVKKREPAVPFIKINRR